MSDEPGDEEVRFQPIPEFPGMQLLSARQCTRLWKVYHEAYAISGIRRGPGEYYYRHAVRHTPRGGVTLFEPGEVHVTRRIEEPADFHVIFIAPEAMRCFAAELGMSGVDPHLRVVQLNRAPLYRAFRRITASIEGGAPVLERQSLFLEFLRTVLSLTAENSPRTGDSGSEPSAVRRARSLLMDRFDENVTLDELAREAGLSRFHLHRMFCRHVGMTPHQFHLRVRLAKAKSLMDQAVPLVSAATRAGFTDQSHFHHHFKNHYGVTPGRYVRGLHGCR